MSERGARRPPTHSNSAKDVEPSGRCARTSIASPPTKAQTRPVSRPNAMVTTTASDEHQVWLRVADPQIWPNAQFEQGRHHRADRSEQQGHEMGRFLGEAAKGRTPTLPGSSRRPIRRRRLGGVSHGSRRSGNGPMGLLRTWLDRRVRVSRETARWPRFQCDGSLIAPAREAADPATGRTSDPRRPGSTRRFVFHVKPRDVRCSDCAGPVESQVSAVWHAADDPPGARAERPAMVESILVRASRAGH